MPHELGTRSGFLMMSSAMAKQNPYGSGDVGLAPRLPSGMSATGSRLAAATETFGALPVAGMIPAFQSGGPRKHPPVGLGDLLRTVRVFTADPGQPGLLSQAPAFRRG